MGIILQFGLKYWKHLLVISAIVFSCYMIYNTIYDIGFEDASVRYQAEIKKRDDLLEKKVAELEGLSNTIVIESRKRNDDIKADLAKIYKESKKAPLTVVNQVGECIPSQNFLDSLNKAIDRANSK